MQSRKSSQDRAVRRRHPSARAALAALSLGAGLLGSAPASAQATLEEFICATSVQGKVAWNQAGNTAWNIQNLLRLCQSTPNAAATVNCFQGEIRSHNDWSRGITACRAQPAGAMQPQPAAPPVAVAPAAPVVPAAPPVPPVPPQAAETNGRNAVEVQYGQGSQRLGSFRMVGARQWAEFNAAGAATHRFNEVQRDDWSVYLNDPSRNVNIQLDLHTRKVMYSEGNGPRRELYNVLGAGSTAAAAPPPAPVVAAPAPVPAPPPQAAPAPAPQAAVPANGRNAVEVQFGQGGQRLGSFRMVGPRQWAELNAAGAVTHRFEEVQRDDWSVYLQDNGRGVNIQLDLHTRKVMYSERGGPRRELYTVMGATGRP